MTDRIGSDEIAAQKRIAEEERDAHQRNRRESLRARAELEEDRRRELAEAERLARLAVQQHERFQREAEDQLREKVRGPDALRQIANILAKPGIATARGFAGQAALVQTSRPKGGNGAVSFHFKVTSAAKGSSALIDVISRRRGTGAPTSDPDQHQDYIERRGAAESLGATEMQHYVENSTRTERLPDGVVASSFGNIVGDRDERRRFWRAVQDAERNASPTQVSLQPSARPDIWSSVRALAEHDSEIPPVLIAALETSAAVSAEITDADAVRLVEIFREAGVAQFRQRGKQGASARPISFRPGRSGRIQLRLVIELPHEMNARQRFDLAHDFCSQYESQSLPYWAVIHAPNAHNDDKNYHLHINLSERPARRISDPKASLVPSSAAPWSLPSSRRWC